MPSLSGLSESILTQVSQRKTDAYLIELNKEGSPNMEVKENGDVATHLAFQYFPDSITDAKGINYAQKEIPGGSLPLYQFVNGGERLISFTAQFTTDVDLLTVEASTSAASLIGLSTNITDRLKAAGASRRNVDIRAAIAWLRRYMYPTYSSGDLPASEGTTITVAPKKLRLVLPGSGIGLAGASANSDSVRVIMTQCDITYDAFFPSGLPRVATVALAFAEVAQFGGSVEFPQRDTTMDDAVSSSGIAFTFGYGINPKDHR